MKRKKHDARARFRRIMRGAGFKYDGKELTGVDRTGRPLTQIEAEVAWSGAWRYTVDLGGEDEYPISQWSYPDELFDIMNEYFRVHGVEPVEWVATIIG